MKPTIKIFFALSFSLTLFAQGALAKKPSTKSESWYVQTIIMVEYDDDLVYDDRSGVFGRIPSGQSGKDIHDIKAFESVAGSDGAIVMMTSSDSFGEEAGQYLSDYRAPGTNRQVWDFTVTSKQVGATVTVAWDGFYTISQRPGGGFDTQQDNRNSVMRGLKLIDLSTGEVVAKGANGKGVPGSYTFVMDETMQRQFRWVQGPVKGAKTLTQDAPRLAMPSAVSLLRADSLSLGSGRQGFPAPPGVGDSPKVLDNGAPEGHRIEK